MTVLDVHANIKVKNSVVVVFFIRNQVSPRTACHRTTLDLLQRCPYKSLIESSKKIYIKPISCCVSGSLPESFRSWLPLGTEDAMGEGEIDTSRLTLSVQRGPPTAASSHAHLQIFKDGVNVGEVLAGDRDVTVLGRNSGMSHEVLEHQSISRKHAALVHDGDGSVFAADLGSTHGTYVNGCKIPAGKATKLSNGDVLKFGESTR